MKTVWVVQMWNEDTNNWDPTIGVGLSRADGRDEKAQWQGHNPDDKFRLRPYVPLAVARKTGLLRRTK